MSVYIYYDAPQDISWNYTLDANNATIGDGTTSYGNATTLGTSLSGAITIPSTVDGYTVTGIGYRAFYGYTNLTSIDLSGTQVETISQNAFTSCLSLETIDLPNSLITIGDYAFQSCMSLETIDLHDSVTTIGYWAFRQCTGLTSIDLSGTQVETIGGYAFSKCSGLISIDLGNSVTTINSWAFAYCSNLPSIDLSGTQVRTIGDYAFSYCSKLTSIDLGNSLETIGQRAFYNCSKLPSIDLSGTQVETIGQYAFYKCTNLTSIDLPNSLTNISRHTFYNCTSLETIDLSGTQVTNIDRYAFSSCSNLTSIDLGNSVTSIGSFVFRECTSLTSITIPDSVTSIGSDFVSKCSSLSSITVDANNNSFSDISGVLFNKDKSTLIQYPIGKTATSYKIPHSVTTIGQYAFYNCTSLETIDLSGTQVETIGDSAFFECLSLTSIDLGNSVTTIGQNAFYLCSSLTSIDFPNSVTTIGSSAFQNCTSLTSITVHANNNSFSDINGVLFNKNQSTLIQYPIGKTATSYTFPDSVTTIGNNAFYKCTSLTSIHIHDSVETIGSSAFYGCTKLTSIDLGNSVTTIGYYAFRACSNLTSIVIPDSVTSIGSSAFGSSWQPIGSPSIVYVKDVDPNDDYNMTTLKNTISGKISGTVTYTQWVAPNYAPNTPTLSDISCNENTNTPYTATVSATDYNDDALTFSLSGADAADFTLSGTDLSGNAVLSAKAVFDFETKATYNITITASDGSLNTSADFTITVNNVVETASDLRNANVQGAILKTTADNDGISTQQLVAAGYTSQHLLDAGYLHSDICFVEGTPVNTDQGSVAIDKIDVSKHTIRGKPIVAVTKTIADEKHLVRIRKDALAKNVPSQDTLTTQNHTFFYNGNMVKAKHLVNKLDNVVLVKYDGSTLYNVLQDKHEKMVVNNLIAETLHPNHCIAQIYRYFAENKVSPEMQQQAIASLRKDQVNKKLTK